MNLKQTGKILKYSYLKNPYYHWTINNDKGGSFSNSGQHKSFNKCTAELRSAGGIDIHFRTYSVDGDFKKNKTLVSMALCGSRRK